MKITKDEKLEITFNDKEYLADILKEFDITPEELCYQLTAYEKAGVIDFKRGIVDILNEKVDKPTYSDLVDFLNEKSYNMVYEIDEFDEIESGEDPSEIARRTFYGDFNPGISTYFTFNGYGNYKGYEDLDDAIKDNPEFEDWYYERKLEDLIDDADFEEDIVEGTLQLVKQGY